MKRVFITFMVAAVAAIAFGGVAASASPNKLQSFGTGTVTINGDSATIDNNAGEYGGVFLTSRSLSAKPLNAVHLSFDSSGDTAGGAPMVDHPRHQGIRHPPDAHPLALASGPHLGRIVAMHRELHC